METKVVVTGGGTGGHLKVAKAFIDEFHKRGIFTIFIGSKIGQDQKWFKNEQKLKKAIFLDTKGVVNKKFLGKIVSLFKIIKQISFCLNIFKKDKINVVICVGGFSAAPATFASILSYGCKLYIHEQNSKMGSLNTLASNFATEIFSSYLNNSKIKDYPVSNSFFYNSRIRKKIKTIIFLGGSQGAKGINDFAINISTKLNNLGIKIIHQTGKADFIRVKQQYEALGIDVDLFAFTNNIEEKMNKADFAISRSGASTLWELVANSLPALFIPYTYAAKNHQYYNAKILKDKGLCFLCEEKNLSFDLINKILSSNVNSISKKLTNLIAPHAIKSIVDIIVENNQK